MAWRIFQSFVLIIALFAVALLLLTVGSGCDRQAEADAHAASASAPSSEVRIGYFCNATHAQAVLGVASGDFARAVAPSRLTARVFNAGPSLIEALFAGQIDIGYVGPGPLLNAWQITHGQGIRVIAGSAANGVLIVARNGSGIHSLTDLPGQRIATPQYANTQDIAARHYLLSVLKCPDANYVLAVPNSEQAGMMARGQIDAAWVPEPWGTRLIDEAGATLVARESDHWPGEQFALTLVVASPDFLAQHPDVVKKILAVHADWTRRLEKDPQAYASQLDDALGVVSGKRLKPGITAEALKNVQFTLNPLPHTLTTMAKWTRELGLARGTGDLNGLIDLRLLPPRAGR